MDRLRNGAVATSTGLYALAVDAWGIRRCEAAFSGLLPAVVVDVLYVECMQVAWEVAVDDSN